MSDSQLGKQDSGRALDWIATSACAAMLAAGLTLLLMAVANPGGFPGVVWSRESLVCFVVLFVPCLVPAWRVGPAFVARYDNKALSVLPASGEMHLTGPVGQPQQAMQERLQAWCSAGAGTGRSPWFAPWVRPDIGTLFSVALLSGESHADSTRLAEAFSRQLDGSDHLASLDSKWARLTYRLKVKQQDCQWWRARETSDAWDSGYLLENPEARAALNAFVPRRATLLVADQLSASSVKSCIAILRYRCANFRHPVRLLVIDSVQPARLEIAGSADTALLA